MRDERSEMILCKIFNVNRPDVIARGTMIKAIAKLNDEVNRLTKLLYRENPGHPFFYTMSKDLQFKLEMNTRAQNKVILSSQRKWQVRFRRFILWLHEKCNEKRNTWLMEQVKDENPPV